ncbi:unnamed protein product [Brassica rapa]|uniref:FG-GAP repeat-containing protein n=1 Tax=Brassica campestris TaxID=3711 RepID=A0A8D9CUP3_BRACM|nr:unnamed protein product [Brassica rapa]
MVESPVSIWFNRIRDGAYDPYGRRSSGSDLIGSALASIDLPFQPTHALICDDFSNDGLTDVIVMTSNGIYGFVQTRQPGTLFFSSLVNLEEKTRRRRTAARSGVYLGSLVLPRGRRDRGEVRGRRLELLRGPRFSPFV